MADLSYAPPRAAHIVHSLGQGLLVIERGWLNCNQVVMVADDACVLIDSGYGRCAAETIVAVDAALGGRRLDRLINTHCHSDHMGGNRALRAKYGCRITIPAGEVKHVVPWTPQSCWSEEMDQYAEEFSFDDTIDVGETFTAGGRTWEAIAAPGHDMDALMFWCARERILITGDALWERGMGFVWPTNKLPNSFIDAAFGTLSAVEALKPATVIPGHGAPFGDVTAALAVTRAKLTAFRDDPAKLARNVVKTMFTFALLDRGSMYVAEVPAYFARVPVYARINAEFLRLSFDDMARMIVGDLTRNGALRIENETLLPTMRA